jgi:hypothetical protein
MPDVVVLRLIYLHARQSTAPIESIGFARPATVCSSIARAAGVTSPPLRRRHLEQELHKTISRTLSSIGDLSLHLSPANKDVRFEIMMFASPILSRVRKHWTTCRYPWHACRSVVLRCADLSRDRRASEIASSAHRIAQLHLFLEKQQGGLAMRRQSRRPYGMYKACLWVSDLVVTLLLRL